MTAAPSRGRSCLRLAMETWGAAGLRPSFDCSGCLERQMWSQSTPSLPGTQVTERSCLRVRQEAPTLTWRGGTHFTWDGDVPLGSAQCRLRPPGRRRCGAALWLLLSRRHLRSSAVSRRVGSRRRVICRSKSTIFSILRETKEQNRLQKNCFSAD